MQPLHWPTISLMDLAAKRALLDATLRDLSSVMVAYSGGTALVYEWEDPAWSIANLQTYIDSQRHLAAKAREHNVYVAVGLALDVAGGGYANGALLFGRDGSIAGRNACRLSWWTQAQTFSTVVK